MAKFRESCQDCGKNGGYPQGRLKSMVDLFVLIRHIRYKPCCVVMVSGKVEVIFPVACLNCVEVLKTETEQNVAKWFSELKLP